MHTQCFILRLFQKNLKSTILILFITWINLNVGLAQVTIGSSQQPTRGALLDIKSQTPSSDNVTSDKGGLILPRVKLKSLTTLEPFIPTTDPEWINAATSKIKANHIGLLVYNLTISASLQEGVYFWDGTSWKLNDAKVNNGLTINNNIIGLGGTLNRATTITSTGANSLNIAGTAPFTVANPTTIGGTLKITSGTPAANKVLTSDATGNATWTVPNYESTTANNGVALSGKTVQLGGALNKATTITSTGANSLNIAGTAPFTVANPTTIGGTLKITSGTPAANKVLTSDATGNATWTVPNYESTTANNGVALSGKTVQLGGALNKATTIAAGANNLNITTTGTAKFNVNSALSVQNNKVTIGSQNASPIAALLNLQTQVDTNPTQGGVNANGGLMLPRVQLVENNSLKPFIASGGTAAEKASHKGMIVYNIGGNGIDAGQKTWDGQRWLKVITDIPPAPIIRANYFYMKETVVANSSSPQETEQNTSITWMVNNAPSQNITIQESGSYAFMVRIYGEGMPKQVGDTRVNRCVTYYTLMVNGKKVDVQEMNDAIASPLFRLSGTPVLIGDNLKVGDKIQIKFGFWSNADTVKDDLLVKDISLICRSTSSADMRADNTTMVMWKL